MRHTLTLLCLSLGLATTPLPCQDAPPESAGPKPYSIGHHAELESKILGETRHIIVGLPSGYERDNDMRCGVVYMLDGRQMFTTTVAAVQHNALEHPPMMVVGIVNTDRHRDFTPPARPGAKMATATSGGAAKFLRFLVEELRPFLAERYRTNDLSILAGHSLGGLFGAHVLLEQPDAFTGYLVLSPSLWWDDHKLIERLREIPRTHGLYDRHVFISMADESETMNPPFEEVVWHWKERAPKRFRFDVGRYPDRGHATVVPTAIYDGLMAFFEPIRAQGEDESITTYSAYRASLEALSKQYGVKLQPSQITIMSIAHTLGQRGEIEPAMNMLAEAQTHLPKNPILRIAPGLLLEHLERIDEAIAAYQRIVGWIQENERARRWLPMVEQRIESLKATAATKKRPSNG